MNYLRKLFQVTEKLPVSITDCFIEEITVKFRIACLQKCSATDQCRLACYKGNSLLAMNV